MFWSLLAYKMLVTLDRGITRAVEVGGEEGQGLLGSAPSAALALSDVFTGAVFVAGQSSAVLQPVLCTLCLVQYNGLDRGFRKRREHY